MDACSNQTLWKILIGHSSVRDGDLIYNEVRSRAQCLKEGLAYYREPCKESEEKLKRSAIVKGTKLQFVLEISKHLHLDQMLSLELFGAFFSDSVHFVSAELGKNLAKEKEQQKLLSQLLAYYILERRHLLRCVKHMFGYWQDSSHPYRETYGKCLDLLQVSDHLYIEGILKQYEKCANSEVPSSLKSEGEQTTWLMANLHEQCELLEIVLLYHKDYCHPLPALLKAATCFQALGFGMRHVSHIGMMPAAKVLVNHISHLCCLVLVEAMDLDFLLGVQEEPTKFDICDYVMLDKGEFQGLDQLISQLGDVQYHSPVFLAWAVLKFVSYPEEGMENARVLGARALSVNVFGYLRDMLDSPFFSGDRPVSMTCQSIVQVLLSNCVAAFHETSLGDPMTLIAVATKSLSHPRLCLEFWCKGLNKGVGILLSSALKRFPLDLSSVLHFLGPLATSEVSACKVFQLLSQVQHYTDDFARVPAHSVDVGREVGSWVITKPLPLYPRESRHLDLAAFMLPVGTEGVALVTEGDEVDSRQIIGWNYAYSAWELFALITCSILYSPGVGIDPAPSSLVDAVADIAKLVTQVLQQDWSLERHLQPITSQYFTLVQRYSSLPHPPCLLLAECLKCMSVMARKDSQKVWQQLSCTGFLPHINFAPSSIAMISVAPGRYGQLMNSWERPRGIYPVSMAMLDLLLSGFPCDADWAYSGDALACVVLVMREMFAGSHSWRYRHSANRDQIGHKLLQLCHLILSNSQRETNKGYSVKEFVRHFLLHSVGSHSLLSTLSLSLDTINTLYSSRLSVSSPVLQVEALKIAFQVIDLLLQSKRDPSPTPLEQALAVQSVKRRVDSHSMPTSVHLVAVIASYIHHHSDPQVPAGATKLLTRLSQVAPMSVLACLGSESASIRDAFVHRLKSHVEDVELKVAILELVTECVSSQPGMMELFLKIQPACADSAQNKAVYELGEESCLHAVVEFINPSKKTPPTLLRASLSLLRSLWAGRHDAALIALRAQRDFWKNLTRPLLEPAQDLQNDSDVDRLACAHIMFIVSLEIHSILRNKMDASLIEFLNDFSSGGCYEVWMKRMSALQPSPADSAVQDVSPADSAVQDVSPADSAVQGQLQVSRAWSTFLCVGASQARLFHLTSPDLRGRILESLLTAMASQLSLPPPSSHAHSGPAHTRLLVVEELSVLCVVLMKRWASDVVICGATMMQSFVAILSPCNLLELEPGAASNVLVCVYSSVVRLLAAVRADGADLLEPRYVLELIPHLQEAFKNHSLYLGMECKQRPDILAVYVLNEMVMSMMDSPAKMAMCLEVLRQHSIVSVLGMLLGEHLNLATDFELVSAIFGFFITLSNSKGGGEALLVNQINHHVNISLANTLSLNLAEWAETWTLALHLMSNLLDSLTHQFLHHAIDFVGVFQERLVQAVDIDHALHDLRSLEETRCVCQFLFQLSLFKQQWRFATPTLHSDLIQRLIGLTSSAAAVVSNGSNLKHIVRTLGAAGRLAPRKDGLRRGRGQEGVITGSAESAPQPTSSWMHDDKMEQGDTLVTTSPDYSRIRDWLISILTSCLATLRHYCPPLGPMLTEGGVDLLEYPPLFALSLAPPTVQLTTPPSLATLTACLAAGIDLLNKLDPPRVGILSRSPTKSPRSAASGQKRAEYLVFLEQAVCVLLCQTTRYLVDPGIPAHDKLELKKELASELGNFTSDLLRNFTRKGAPSPARTKLATPGMPGHTPSGQGHTLSLQDSFSLGKGSSQTFSDASEQLIFKLADSFSKQVLK